VGSPAGERDDPTESASAVAGEHLRRLLAVTDAAFAHMDTLPEIAGFDVAARYIPGAAIGIGGDWYDLFQLRSGHIGLAIGDVTGNGLRAAVIMGRIRSALRAYALETVDPAEVLARLDATTRRTTAVPLPWATLLYTDGLVERRGVPLSKAMNALVGRLRPGTAEDLCARATTHLQNDPATDDGRPHRAHPPTPVPLIRTPV
jgi:Stage II sporulation protein E (SpoIIE)